MGTTTTSRYVPVNGRNVASLTNRVIISDAVNDWYHEEASRYDDPRVGGGVRSPLRTDKAAQIYVGQHSDEAFEHSLIIPVAKASDVKTFTRKAKMTVTGEVLSKLHAGNTGWVIFTQAYKEYGIHLVGVEVLKTPVPRKPVVTSTEGKMVTEYVVKTEGRSLAVCDSKVEAQKEAVRLMSSPTPRGGYVTLTVEAVVVREGGTAALAVIKRPVPETAVVDVLLGFSEPKPNSVPDGFLVEFAYHS